MSVFEKAKELGQEIKESQEYKEVRKTGQDIHDNADAQQIIQDIQTVESQLEFAQNAGIEPTQEQIDEFNNIQSKMEGNSLIQAYLKAQDDYSQLMQKINQSISEEING